MGAAHGDVGEVGAGLRVRATPVRAVPDDRVHRSVHGTRGTAVPRLRNHLRCSNGWSGPAGSSGLRARGVEPTLTRPPCRRARNRDAAVLYSGRRTRISPDNTKALED